MESILLLEPKGFLLEICYHPNPTTAFYKLAMESGWYVLTGVEQ